ncbi:hypothetical protein FE257_005786 [Aspergillus nanangensis]|uniref:Uncharacterized protein n=1 Tax=Aspergillus nanangensis TaxID=2582783 RepID=A0AAD4CQ49_ASPNN|nr:hypothetical protein FE257_005786 [Aspergillus nanangensis]
MAAAQPPTRGEKATFNYLVWQDLYREVKPYRTARTEGEQTTNLKFDLGDVQTVHDVRGGGELLTLDKNGFVYLNLASAMEPADFYQPEKIENIFLPECQAVLRGLFSNHTVLIFNWRVRRNRENFNTDDDQPPARIQLKSTSQNVHVDQSWSSTARRVRLHFPDKAESILSSRVQMLNIWRPINGPVQDRPLAVCDARTVNKGNMVEVDILRDNYVGHIMYPLYDPGMTWYYMSGQDNTELLIFKSFDTAEGVAKCTDA